MPSVDANWNGTCSNRQTQQDLCRKLLPLAEISCGKFQEFFGIHAKPVIYNEPEGEKDYLVSFSVFGKKAPPENLERVDRGVFIGRHLGLYGIDFPLYDPRNYSSMFGLHDQNRISFVFIRSKAPELDGLLVRVLSGNQQHYLNTCKSTILCTPILDLRYYLEFWTRSFLGWVKHFYIPNLTYWLYGDLSGYQQYAETQRTSDLCDSIYDQLLSEFESEAVSFTQTILSYK